MKQVITTMGEMIVILSLGFMLIRMMLWLGAQIVL